MSLFESFVNVFVGLGIAILTQMIVFPFFDISISFGDNVIIACIFTVISIFRSYLIRRLFNGYRQTEERRS